MRLIRPGPLLCVALLAAGLSLVLPEGLRTPLYQVALLTLGGGLMGLVQSPGTTVSEVPGTAEPASGSDQEPVAHVPDRPAAAPDDLGDAASQDPLGRYRALADAAPSASLVTDVSGRIDEATGATIEMLGRDVATLLGEDVSALAHPDDVGLLVSAMRRAAEAPAGAKEMLRVRLRHSDGGWRHAEVSVVNLLDQPDVGGLVLNCRDQTDRHEMEDRLRSLAFTDELTGLPNRASLVETVRGLQEQGAGDTLALLLVDLDDFRTVNDSMGSAAGDEMLGAVGGRVAACLRPSDTAARVGGDVFAALLRGAGGAEEARRVAARVREALAAPLSVQGREMRTSATVGIALGRDAGDASELLVAADMALNGAKRGAEPERVYDPRMHLKARRRMELKADLERGIERGEFLLHYQPIVDLPSGRAVGVEALARWSQPGRGLVPPVEFIPLAEETGLIVRLGAVLLSSACKQVREWQAMPGLEDLYVSVNLSPRQLTDPDLVETVSSALRSTDLRPSRLLLELTESLVVPGNGEVLDALRRLGVPLALDDFGTGYSNLSHLQRFQLDVLKIDRSFVKNAGDPEADRLLGSIVDLAANLGARSVAEGIETEGQLQRLRDMNCQLGQGYLFSAPVDPTSMTAFLRASAMVRTRPVGVPA